MLFSGIYLPPFLNNVQIKTKLRKGWKKRGSGTEGTEKWRKERTFIQINYFFQTYFLIDIILSIFCPLSSLPAVFWGFFFMANIYLLYTRHCSLNWEYRILKDRLCLGSQGAYLLLRAGAKHFQAEESFGQIF